MAVPGGTPCDGAQSPLPPVWPPPQPSARARLHPHWPAATPQPGATGAQHWPGLVALAVAARGGPGEPEQGGRPGRAGGLGTARSQERARRGGRGARCGAGERGAAGGEVLWPGGCGAGWEAWGPGGWGARAQEEGGAGDPAPPGQARLWGPLSQPPGPCPWGGDGPGGCRAVHRLPGEARSVARAVGEATGRLSRVTAHRVVVTVRTLGGGPEGPGCSPSAGWRRTVPLALRTQQCPLPWLAGPSARGPSLADARSGHPGFFCPGGGPGAPQFASAPAAGSRHG